MARNASAVKAVRRLVALSFEHLSVKSFSKALGTHNSKFIDSPGLNVAKETVFEYTISESLCLPQSGSKPSMAVSSVLAVFDELSTFGLMATDKTCRTGVSVRDTIASVFVYRCLMSIMVGSLICGNPSACILR